MKQTRFFNKTKTAKKFEIFSLFHECKNKIQIVDFKPQNNIRAQ